MSSYLYIIKSELPLVIQTFLNLEDQTSDWYMNGNYLVILVSVVVILPLALMRQLGERVAGPWGCGQRVVAHGPPPPQATWATPAASPSAAWCSSSSL